MNPREVDPVAAIPPAIASLPAGRKVFVLDTNVLLHDPTSLFRFQENLVVIPLPVMDEIDAKKSDPVIGFNSREVSKKIEHIVSKSGYSPERGARIPNGNDGLLFFMWGGGDTSFPEELKLSYFDNFLLSSLQKMKRDLPGRAFVLVTKDRNLRIKSQALGIAAQDYLHDRVTEDSLTGAEDPLRTIQLLPKEIEELFSGKKPAEWRLANFSRVKLRPHEGVILQDEQGNHVGLGIRAEDALRFVQYEAVRVLGVGPKVLDHQRYAHNFEQAVCMLQSLEDRVRLHVMVGKAGTGKTHIAMAAALELVFIRKKYDSIKLVKPVITQSRLGEDLGFLPGTVRKKLIPRMRPFVEKLQKFVGSDFLNGEQGYQKLLDEGVIEMMNLADIRGADLAGSVVVFDEAQNANPFQMRTLGTRLGEDAKLMVLGDPTQIDNVYLDKYSNALVNLYQNARRSPEPFIATVSLTQMVRSYTSKWFEEHIVSTVKKR